jgi:drug/metabolite transporter (DMT)-like permease
MSMRTAFAERFGMIPAPVQGAIMMSGAAFGFSLMAGLIRFASESLEPLQVVFFRNFFALLFMLPWLTSAGVSGLRTRRFGLHLLRAVVGLVSMGLWFTSIALLPLAQAVSLNFTVPLFTTAGAALVLGEVVRARRWTATIVGFLGVLVIVRPGMQEVSPVLMLPILAALTMAAAVLMVKTLSRTEDANAMVFYMNFFLAPLSLIPALFVWRWPDWPTLAAMAGVGLIAVLAHILVARSFKLADASAVVPFQYARLPFTALVGFLFFAEVPDVWTFVAAGIIAAVPIYIVRPVAHFA